MLVELELTMASGVRYGIAANANTLTETLRQLLNAYSGVVMNEKAAKEKNIMIDRVEITKGL